jgi:hypothetical protein
MHSKKDQRKISDGWFKYYGFRIPAEKICCDGCTTDDSENPKLIDPHYFVRLCVIEKGLKNCAHCERYVCENLETRIVDYNQIATKFQQPIPKKDYKNFISPYEGRKVLG